MHKKVEAQRVQTVVISSLHESRNFDAIMHKENRLRNKKHASNTVITTKDGSTADKNINQDDTWNVVKGVTNVARSTTLKWYAEGPRSVQSMLLRKETFRSTNPVSKW